MEECVKNDFVKQYTPSQSRMAQVMSIPSPRALHLCPTLVRPSISLEGWRPSSAYFRLAKKVWWGYFYSAFVTRSREAVTKPVAKFSAAATR